MTWLDALTEMDHSILLAVRDLPSWSVSLFYVITVIGGGWGMIALVPFLVAKASRRTTLLLLAAILVTSGLGNALKALVGRIRPCDALAWCAPLRGVSPGGWSFPSGHAAGSFAFAAFIALRAPRYAPLALAYAVLVASSRFVLGVHYPTDVFAGALLGSLVGAAFAALGSARGGDSAAAADTASAREPAPTGGGERVDGSMPVEMRSRTSAR
jgi:undecaprenyl-diphosphatase